MSRREAGGPRREAGSFRDYESRVFQANGVFYRALSSASLKDYSALEASDFFRRAQESGLIVRTGPASGVIPPPDAEPPAGCAGVLKHEAIPFVSWPYEWPFSMLKDAALSQLEILRGLLDEDLVLKDGTPYNTQWQGARPVFIDIGSIEKAPGGEPWFGYRQFCMQFLYPLMLQAFLGVSFRPFLRGRVEGITPDEMKRLISGRHRLRRGVLTHVVLHARLERRHSSRSARRAREDLKRAGFKRELIAANAAQLTRLIGRLDWAPRSSEWSGYGETHGYAEDELESKATFVERAAARLRPALVWDLGCNDGRFSRIASQHADYVVSLDADELAVDRFYRELRSEGNQRILPLTMDIVDSSPALGWRGEERRRFEDRGAPDLVLALALIHHISIGSNVPITDLLGWLASIGSAVVIEFPERHDPLVETLLSRKRVGAHPDYELETFETELARRFSIRRSERIGTRVLYEADPR